MSATKILWGQITIVFLIILATTWGATQYVASSLGYQAQLGPPWFVMFGVPIYYPPAIFWWWYFYEAYAPPIFAKGGIIAASEKPRICANRRRSAKRSRCPCKPVPPAEDPERMISVASAREAWPGARGSSKRVESMASAT